MNQTTHQESHKRKTQSIKNYNKKYYCIKYQKQTHTKNPSLL